MASITKRGKTWQYTVSRVVEGKQKPIRKGGFKTKKEAQQAAAEVELALAKDTLPSLKEEPFANFFETWLRLYKTDVSKNTLQRYRDSLKTVREYFGDKPIQKINKRSYQLFLNEFGQTHARSSTRKLNTHIRACVKDAIDEGLIQKDFTRGAVLTGEKGKRSEEKHLDFEDSVKLLKELYNRLDKGLMNYLLLLALTSGARFGELVGLTRKDFDFKNNTITINKTWGYTGQMHEGFGPTKNEQSIRTIAMDPQTMKAFQRLFMETPENIHRLVFYSPKSKYGVLSNGAANKALEGILNELGIKPITFHSLRHTSASILLYQDVSIYYVSERLGHGDIETTMNTYAHIVKELRQKDEERTAKVFEKMSV